MPPNVVERSPEHVVPVPRGTEDLPGLVTTLLAEVDGRAGDAETASDIVRRYGGVEVGVEIGVEIASATWVVSAMFHSVCDATRAVVEIADAVAGADRRPGAAPVGARMALCTIEVDRGGPHRHGAASVRAAQLLARTGPGQILATAPTAVVAGPTLPAGIELVDRGLWTPLRAGPPERVYEIRIGRYAVDGVAGGAVASNLEWARRAVHQPIGPYPVGVDAHLATIDAAWRDTLDGHGKLVLVSGGTGAVRNAVTAEVALRLHTAGALVLYGQWAPRAQAPYRAFREALGVHADGCSIEQLVADLEGWVDEVAQLLPEVGARLCGSGRVPARAAAEPAGVVDAVDAWLCAITDRTPAVLVLADAHRAEPSSVALLTHLWHLARGRRLLLVVSGDVRAGAIGDRWPELVSPADAGALERIRLD